MTLAKKAAKATSKTLINTSGEDAAVNVSDIEFHGNPDTFKLIAKASSKGEGWMKSTKAMQVKGVGCFLQVTTQQGDNIAEAVTFAPGTKLFTDRDNKTHIVAL